MASIGIYKIENKINGKVYIGQSVNIFKRWSVHANPKKSPDMVITKAITRYGIAVFNFEVLELCDKELLNTKETYWIAYYDSYSNGYNSTKGGDSSEFKESKIKEVTANEIQKLLLGNSLTKVEIAKMYGVAESTIRAINVGDTWVNPTLDYPLREGYLRESKEIVTCSNCGININRGTKHGLCSKCTSIKLRKVIRPSKIELLGKMLRTPNTKVGKYYGVSDNTIKKWCKYYGIPSNFRMYNKLKWSRGEDSNFHISKNANTFAGWYLSIRLPRV